jgi:hypothetical protein
VKPATHARLGHVVRVSARQIISRCFGAITEISWVEHGYCGTTAGHCSEGCQPLFGICNSPKPPQPSSTLKVSLNGSCGQKSGQTCRGSTFGDCCSQYSFCGQTLAYCSEGCQSQFGDCDETQKRSLVLDTAEAFGKKGLMGRADGGSGPDYTYPPIPHTTISTSVTHVIIVFPSGVISTTTVLGVTTTTVGGIITFTQTSPIATRTATVCPTG